MLCSRLLFLLLGHLWLSGVLIAAIDGPTYEPTETPTHAPTHEPTVIPTHEPTEIPTTHMPSFVPTTIPTHIPTFEPTYSPTILPSTSAPSNKPTLEPTEHPSHQPTHVPTGTPTSEPSYLPTLEPSEAPTTEMPSRVPTHSPSSARPSIEPTHVPTGTPTSEPSYLPTLEPSESPTTEMPSGVPTHSPSTAEPSIEPTREPTVTPSFRPSLVPTLEPSESPTTEMPSGVPTHSPSTAEPSMEPTVTPTISPSSSPTVLPTPLPTRMPTISLEPTAVPTTQNEPIISWKSTLYIDNVSGGTLDDAAKKSIQNATALGMQVRYSELEFDSDVIQSTAVLSSAVVTTSNSKNFIVTLKTTVSMNNYPYSSAMKVYTVLVGNLNKSISDNTFDKNLLTSSRINGATILYSANCTKAQYSEPTVKNPTDESSSSDALSAGTIVGIVVGLIAGAIIIFLGVYFYYKRRGSTSAAFQRWQTHAKNAFDPANITPMSAPGATDHATLSQMHTGVKLNAYLAQYGDPAAVHLSMTPVQTTPDAGLNPMISAERHRSMASSESTIPLNQLEMQTLERLQNLERIRLQQLNSSATTSPGDLTYNPMAGSPPPPPPPPGRARKVTTPSSTTTTPSAVAGTSGEARQIAVPFALPGLGSPAQAAMRRASLNPINAVPMGQRPASVQMQQSSVRAESADTSYSYENSNEYGTSSVPFQQGFGDSEYGSPMNDDVSSPSTSSRIGGAGRGGRGGGANIAAMARRKSQVGILQGVSSSAVAALSLTPTTPTSDSQDAPPPSRDRRSQRFK